MARRPPIALSIAGSDPTGAAGFQRDLQVFARLGVHGMAVPTALIVQTTERVHRVLPAFPNVVGEQLLALLTDIVPDVIKIGVLATDDVLLRVANLLDRFDVPRVVDPVLRASEGSFLLERRAWGSLMERVVRDAALVTPNRPEAEELTGESDPEKAAAVFLECGARAVLVKGGHAEGAPDDLLVTAERSVRIEGRRIGQDSPGGTGCALSSAIACQLARGADLESAVRESKAWLERAIETAFRPGRGRALLGVDEPTRYFTRST